MCLFAISISGDFMSLKVDVSRFVDDVMVKAQLASCLEVSGYPKPGNVHRLRDFSDTRFEHFIAGGVAIGPSVRISALNGFRAGLSEIDLCDVGVGSLIKRAVLDVRRFHGGGNTHFGVAVLFVPLAASAGMCFAREDCISEVRLREYFTEIVESTTVEDALNFYDALKIAGVGGLGRISSSGFPDVSSESFRDRILKDDVTLYDLMYFSSGWDLIASEFVSGLEIVFSVGYPFFIKFYSESRDVNVAIVHAFLKLLSFKPDTFIARKYGLKFTSDVVEAVRIGLRFAEEISRRAVEILELGGLESVEGRRLLFKLDEELAEMGLNPGSTADILAASLFTALLLGFRL